MQDFTPPEMVISLSTERPEQTPCTQLICTRMEPMTEMRGIVCNCFLLLHSCHFPRQHAEAPISMGAKKCRLAFLLDHHSARPTSPPLLASHHSPHVLRTWSRWAPPSGWCPETRTLSESEQLSGLQSQQCGPD